MLLRDRHTSLAASSLALGVLAALAACGELKTAAPDDADGDGGSRATPRDDGSSGTSGTSGALPGDQAKKDPPPGFGPGPYGALPSGYCCDDDGDCRSRRCEDLGGGKVCRDSCRSDSTCRRSPELEWTCDNGGTPGAPGFCKPDGAFTCIPAAEFELGTRAAGECCTATGDGFAGLECVGGSCVAIGESPFICNHRCLQPKDCPSGFVCQQITDDRKECIPANRPYTCK
ncbi:MAG: hypothetical protein KF850_11870 [Labilithrix sp.]|nr:hypothetical protein [Labilithrix sp.]